MKAVIVAAGKGTRITDLDTPPKPLLPVLGVTLLERVVRTALQGGCDKVVVVVGYRGDEIRSHVEKRFNAELRRSVVFLENSRYEEANGLSILACSPAVGSDDFLVLMSDHLVDSAIIRRLVDVPAPFGGAMLAVDADCAAIPDLDDATKVVTTGAGSVRGIVAIGKSLSEYDSIDTGCFRMTSGIFDALAESETRGDTSISGAIATLARKGSMAALDVTGMKWIDVDTREMIPHAERFLLTRLGKGRDGPVSRIFNRPLSLAMTRYLARTAFTPNMATVAAALCGLLAAAALAKGQFVLGAILVHLHSVVDGIDGEIARLKYTSSYLGGWYDRLGDMIGEYAIFIGIAWGTGAWILAAAAFLLNSLAVASGDSLTAMGLMLKDRWDPAKTILPKLAPWQGRDVMLFVLALLCLLQGPQVFFFVIIFVRGIYLILQAYCFGTAIRDARS